MSIPTVPLSQLALFSDFDGTLVSIAAKPDQVQVAPKIVALIRQLHDKTQGATALITGRGLDNINALLPFEDLAIAGSHGAEWQLHGNYQSVDQLTSAFAPIRPALEKFALDHNLLTEDKSFAIAVHFRQSPELEPQLDQFLQTLVPENGPLTVMAGKAIREVKPKAIDKGKAIARFMQQAPFAQRTPLYLGDDVTDEAGFEWVNQAGGISIKVGPGATCAQHRLEDPEAVLAFLHQLLNSHIGAAQ